MNTDFSTNNAAAKVTVLPRPDGQVPVLLVRVAHGKSPEASQEGLRLVDAAIQDAKKTLGKFDVVASAPGKYGPAWAVLEGQAAHASPLNFGTRRRAAKLLSIHESRLRYAAVPFFKAAA